MEENRKEAEFKKENCVICLKGVIAENPRTKVGKKGLLTLIEFSKRHKYTQLEQYLKKLKRKEVLVYKKCPRDFTDIKRSKLTLRSSRESFSWKTYCFLCSKEVERDDKDPNRKQIFNVTLIPFRNLILEHCRNRNDEWANIIETRISCSSDLIADEAVYHRECLTRFMLN